MATILWADQGNFQLEALSATEDDLRSWRRRLDYASSWKEVTGAERLQGLRYVTADRLVEHAIGSPLASWCLLVLFNPGSEELRDYDRVRVAAPWVWEAWPDLGGGLIDELRRHHRALVVCPSERVARGLARSTGTKGMGVRVFSPSGQWSHHS